MFLPLTDSANNTFPFSFLTLNKHNEGSKACFYDNCLFTVLAGQRLRVCARKHYVLSFTHTAAWENSL